MVMYGLLLLLVALLAAGVWYAWYRLRGRPPPSDTGGRAPAPAERERTWDPRERYDDDPDGGLPRS